MAFDWRNPERVSPWKPRQQFELTPLGREAVQQYREAVAAAQRSASPRSELDRAKRSWADVLGVRPGDGILLEEVADGCLCLADMHETLEAVGLTLREARGTLDRLKATGLVDAVGGPGPA